ncbi:MAG: RluA family pseudouridine synthase [Acidobacteria bacterium]|nr:RluA family pseudouridine synthase [Acidobacteriota bacterium]MBI3655581.1 RluA family pseudouridine synthase [Acidobacteriota bacterium]
MSGPDVIPERTSHRIITVAAGQAAQRLDAFLVKELPELSRSQVQRLIREGYIVVNQKTVKAGYRLRPADVVSIRVPPRPDLTLSAEAIPLQIVYEDDYLIVVDKPAGMVVHSGAGVRSGTLVNALLHRFGSLSQIDAARPGIVHRLDKLTSGLILVAKNDRTHRALSEVFKSRRIRKEYMALVYGSFPHDSGTIDVAIGRDPRDRKKMSPRARHGRAAVTHYSVIKRLAGFTLLRVRLETGRTHQIRVHFHHLQHPVVGDNLYGAAAVRSVREAAKRSAIEELGRYFLHAECLEFMHPDTGQTLHLTSPLPMELEKILTVLK